MCVAISVCKQAVVVGVALSECLACDSYHPHPLAW